MHAGSGAWMGADGVPDGRAVQLFRQQGYSKEKPAIIPKATHPFSASSVLGTKAVSDYFLICITAAVTKMLLC